MASVEAAASLFGSDSPDGDLFASLGADPEPETPAPPQDPTAEDTAHQTTNELVFADTGSSYAATDDLFTSQDANQYPDFTTSLYDAPATQQPPDTTAYQATTHPQQQTQYYNAYEPQTNPYTPPASAPAPAPALGPTAPQPATYATYNPSAYAPAAPSYSPYAHPNPPVAHATYPSYSSAPTVPTYAPPPRAASPPVKAPAPPAPVSALVRPKVVNAYDPPFIPRTPKRAARAAPPPQSIHQPSHPSVTPFPHAPPVHSSGYPTPPGATTGLKPSPQPVAHDPYNSHPSTYGSSTPPPPPSLYAQGPYAPAQDQAQTSPYTPGRPGHQSSPYAPPPTQPSSYSPSSHVQSHQNIKADAVPTSVDKHSDPVLVEPTHGYPNLEHEVAIDQLQSLDNGTPIHPPVSSVSASQDIQRQDPITPPYQPPATAPMSRPSSVSPPPPAPYTNGSAKYSPPSHGPKMGSNGRASPDTSLSGSAHDLYNLQKDKPLKETHDPYAPKLPYSYTNYIPRTSSPLSFPPDRAKHQNGNGAANAYSPPQPSHSTPYAPPSIPRPPSVANDGLKPRALSLSAEAPSKFQNSQYAPSPSLLGSNDPLARTSARAPVISFGFGGRLITCFHGMPGLNAGFDVAFSSRTSSELKIRILHKIIPEAASLLPSANYPGPLISDPSTPALSIVRPAAASQAKSKKAAVVSYLTGRAEEIRQGVAYLNNEERRSAEGKLVLVNLLKIMVENDGKLLGNGSDQAVRMALVPRLETPSAAMEGLLPVQAFRTHGQSDEIPLSTTSTKASSLDTIEDLLLRGERHKALQYANDEKLWAHAMIIASSIDKDTWKSVVNDFLRTELPTAGNSQAGQVARGRESLRVAYSLYSGQGAAAVQELAPVSLLQRATLNIPLPTAAAVTPRTPHFPSVQKPIPADALARWAETAAMIIVNPMSMETSAALTALGDQLLANNWVEAAHACYLLSPQTSPLGGFGGPSARLSLLGCKSQSEVWKDPDYVTLTEILEFALSLVPIAKGQEPFHGLAHLQPYRFSRAIALAETGNTSLATRYCEAVVATLVQGSPYTTPVLVEQLHSLSQRLTGVHSDKSSWIGGKISKPSLDTIGGWLEGRFTKLVTGDSDTPTPIAEEKKVNESPFAHYSTISSATPSARSSPQPQFSNPYATNAPPVRTSSATGFTPNYAPPPIERASSASGYSRTRPNVYTSGSHSISSSQSSPASSFVEKPSSLNEGAQSQRSPLIEQVETPIQDQGGWWDSLGSSTKTPTAATFYQVDEPALATSSSSGFVSLMDSQPMNIAPPERKYSVSQDVLDDEDGLGLGNPKAKASTEPSEETKEASKPQIEPAKQAEAAPAGKGWFSLSRLWNRSGGSDAPTSGPVKASLGEESAFYYDKDLKRWINKNAPPEEKKPALPPPPPSRAQTASPGMASGGRPPPPSSSTPPPPRAASAIDLTTEPPTTLPPAPRIRSNLAPAEADGPPLPPMSRQQSPAPPPPSRPRSQATKRSVRSRYVDVFQQEGGNASS